MTDPTCDQNFVPADEAFGTANLDPASVRRVLICQLRQIGDVLLATPSIELVARRFPQAEIHVFTEKKCLPMLEGNPHIHTVWTVDKKALPTLLHELVFYWKVTTGGFDLVVDFQQLPRCRWVVGLSRAKTRLSFPPPWYTRWLYTHWTKPKPGYAGAYKAGVLAPLGIQWQGERPRLYLSDDERAAADALLARMGLVDAGADSQPAQDSTPGTVPVLPFITVDATHRHATRRWPAAYYAALMDKVVDAMPRMRFLLPFGPGEEKDVRAIRELCRHKDNIIIPPVMMSLRHMAACMERAVLHLGNCSSPRHIAVAVGLPTFTILGATSSGWTFPSPEHVHMQAKDIMSMPCQSCNKNTCPNGLICLTELTPDTVFPKLTDHLQMHGKSRGTTHSTSA